MERLIVAEIPGLRRHARSLVGDGARADDLVQDTLERAWSRQHLWREGTNLKAWLLTILHNLHANQARRDGRRPPTVPVEDGIGLAVAADQDDRAEVRDLGDALARLPQEQRSVVLLVGVEQLSYEEAAGVLGVPVGTIMSRLHRGRERLRRFLDRQDAPGEVEA
jgi:RNA polymerase sigma-70 factor (ECF subfamily)